MAELLARHTCALYAREHVKRPKRFKAAKPHCSEAVNYVAPSVKDIIVNVSKYLDLDKNNSQTKEYIIENYINKKSNTIKKELEDNKINVILLGNGDKIIGQYPYSGTILNEGDTTYFLTNNYDKKMINFTGMSYKETKEILNMMGIEYSLSGYGYVYEQNIPSGEKIDKKIEIKLKGLYD